VPVEPVLAVVVVFVLANLALLALVLLPPLLRGRERGDADSRPIIPAPIRLAAAAGRPDPDLGDGLDGQGIPDRIVRIVSWVYLIAVAAIVVISGAWPETQTAILAVILLAALAVVLLHDIFPPEALGPARPVVEGSIAVTVSIGATLAGFGDTVGAVVKRADALMYQSKENGRNQVTVG